MSDKMICVNGQVTSDPLACVYCGLPIMEARTGFRLRRLLTGLSLRYLAHMSFCGPCQKAVDDRCANRSCTRGQALLRQCCREKLHAAYRGRARWRRVNDTHSGLFFDPPLHVPPRHRCDFEAPLPPESGDGEWFPVEFRFLPNERLSDG